MYIKTKIFNPNFFNYVGPNGTFCFLIRHYFPHYFLTQHDCFAVIIYIFQIEISDDEDDQNCCPYHYPPRSPIETPPITVFSELQPWKLFNKCELFVDFLAAVIKTGKLLLGNGSEATFATVFLELKQHFTKLIFKINSLFGVGFMVDRYMS